MRNLRRVIYLKIARTLGRGNSGPVPSIVSEGTKVKGDIVSGGTVHIDGKLEGDINCEELIIGIKGSVVGTVTANSLVLYGMLQGAANVTDLFVAQSAKLLGDAIHSTIAVEPGAYIEGRCLRKGGSVKVEQTEAKLSVNSEEHREPTLS